MNSEPSSIWRGLTRSVQETEAVGALIGRHCRGGDLIALIGELGAGKTQFVRGLAAGLGLDSSAVASPTFVMVQEHTPAGTAASTGSAAPRLIHIDAYRIRRLDELESIGWEITGDTLGGEMRRDAVVAIEWADNLDELVGSDRLEVRLTHAGEQQREVVVEAVGSWVGRFAKLRGELERLSPPPLAVATPQAAKHKCPICGNGLDTGAETFPFCSKRCRLADLGKWLGGSYVISRPVEESDLDEE